jgi:hypothetical protein
VQGFAALSMLVIGLVTFTVGVRLLLVARRTRQLPEFAFGAAFVAGALGSALAQVGQRLLWDEAGGVATFMNGFCFALMVLSTVLLLVATWRIFRPLEAWAMGACFVGSAAVLIVFGLRVASGELSSAEVHTPAMGFFFICRLVLFAWMSFESLRYYGMLKRRLALGLADPLAMQQIFLWGVCGLATATLTATIAGTIFLLELHPVDFAPSLAIITVLATASSLTMWCAFFPPEMMGRRALC